MTSLETTFSDFVGQVYENIPLAANISTFKMLLSVVFTLGWCDFDIFRCQLCGIGQHKNGKHPHWTPPEFDIFGRWGLFLLGLDCSLLDSEAGLVILDVGIDTGNVLGCRSNLGARVTCKDNVVKIVWQ